MPSGCGQFGRAIDFLVIVSPQLADSLRLEKKLQATVSRISDKLIDAQEVTLAERAEHAIASRKLAAVRVISALEERIARYGAFDQEGVSACRDVV